MLLWRPPAWVKCACVVASDSTLQFDFIYCFSLNACSFCVVRACWCFCFFLIFCSAAWLPSVGFWDWVFILVCQAMVGSCQLHGEESSRTYSLVKVGITKDIESLSCHHFLVGGFNPSEKYESQLGWLFPIDGKIKNVPNHQPVTDILYMVMVQNYQPPKWMLFHAFPTKHDHRTVGHLVPQFWAIAIWLSCVPSGNLR